MATPPEPELPVGEVLLREILLGSVCVTVVVVLVGVLIGSGVIPDPRAGVGLSRGLGFLYSPLSLLAGAGLYALAARRLGGEPTPPLRPVRGRPPAGAALGIAALHVALAILGSYAIGLVMQLVGVPVVEQEQVLEITGGGLGLRPELVLLGITALAAAPISEEILLRGLFFRRLWQQTTPQVAYLASALAFAAIHGNFQGFLVYLWLGLVFARAYALTGRLWCAVLAHFGNNAITLAILVLGGAESAP